MHCCRKPLKAGSRISAAIAAQTSDGSAAARPQSETERSIARVAPTALRRRTSRTRSAARAMAGFTILMHANIRMRTTRVPAAMPPRCYNRPGDPYGFLRTFVSAILLYYPVALLFRRATRRERNGKLPDACGRRSGHQSRADTAGHSRSAHPQEVRETGADVPVAIRVLLRAQCLPDVLFHVIQGHPILGRMALAIEPGGSFGNCPSGGANPWLYGKAIRLSAVNPAAQLA